MKHNMRVFVASNMPTDYPFKLQKPSTVNDRVRDSAEVFIMDSGIGDDIENAEVLNLADEYNADYVVGKDYLHDQRKTTESVWEFIELYEGRDIDATPLIPLQPPYDEHYQQLSGFDRYVLGGMAVDSVDAAQQYRWIREFREVAPNVYAHGLGIGGGIDIVQRLAGSGLLDSVDCATPEMAAQFGAVLDQRLRQQEVRIMNGDGASKRNHALATFNSWQIQDAWEREAKKEGLQQFTSNGGHE